MTKKPSKEYQSHPDVTMEDLGQISNRMEKENQENFETALRSIIAERMEQTQTGDGFRLTDYELKDMQQRLDMAKAADAVAGNAQQTPFTSQGAVGYWFNGRIGEKSIPSQDETNPKDALGTKKPNISLVPASAIIYAAKAMENGAKKYGAYNWRTKKVQALIYIDATLRHILSYLDGEELASDSKVHHLAHALASISILVDAIETGNLIDNRPALGAANRLIEEHDGDKQNGTN